MTITENKNRIGCFTSSEIHKLLTVTTNRIDFGKPALTYIQEKIYERKLKRSLDVEASSRPMLWGKFLEKRVHDMLSTNYIYVYDQTIKHPTILTWSGSPDLLNDIEDVCSDIKCLQPKKFCEVVDDLTACVLTGNVLMFKENHPDKYWQLVSNAIIAGKKNIELIVYMPNESELDEIRHAAANYDEEDQFKYRFIAECPRSELAYLPDDSEYKNLNIFRFPLIESDANLLTQKVLAASIKLVV